MSKEDPLYQSGNRTLWLDRNNNAQAMHNWFLHAREQGLIPRDATEDEWRTAWVAAAAYDSFRNEGRIGP